MRGVLAFLSAIIVLMLASPLSSAEESQPTRCRKAGEAYNANTYHLPVCREPGVSISQSQLSNSGNTNGWAISFDSYMKENSQDPTLATKFTEQDAFVIPRRPASFEAPPSEDAVNNSTTAPAGAAASNSTSSIAPAAPTASTSDFASPGNSAPPPNITAH